MGCICAIAAGAPSISRFHTLPKWKYGGISIPAERGAGGARGRGARGARGAGAWPRRYFGARRIGKAARDRRQGSPWARLRAHAAARNLAISPLATRAENRSRAAICAGVHCWPAANKRRGIVATSHKELSERRNFTRPLSDHAESTEQTALTEPPRLEDLACP